MGHRVQKSVNGITTTYLRDASGIVMATYSGSSVEHTIYGSSRLGIYKGGREAGQRKTGLKNYELSNHLGNVLAVISDKKVLVSDYFKADVVSATDYYPFGYAMPKREYQNNDYRYGFNGQEKTPEVAAGNTDFGARNYDAKIGRWWSPDPLEAKYPAVSTYVAMGNSPLIVIDIDGRDIIVLNQSKGAFGNGHAAILIGNQQDGWTYISKDGPSTTLGNFLGSKSRYTIMNFKSIQEFIESDQNYVLKHDRYQSSDINNSKGRDGVDPKTGIENPKGILWSNDFERLPDGSRKMRYDRALYIDTDEADNDKAIDAVTKEAKSNYQLTTADCSDLVKVALNSVKDRNGNRIYNGEMSYENDPPGILTEFAISQKPNVKFDRLTSYHTKITKIAYMISNTKVWKQKNQN